MSSSSDGLPFAFALFVGAGPPFIRGLDGSMIVGVGKERIVCDQTIEGAQVQMDV